MQKKQLKTKLSSSGEQTVDVPQLSYRHEEWICYTDP